MFRFSAFLASANALSDETSLMQGMAFSAPQRAADKSNTIGSLLESATSLLKNGATPDVVDFAQATLEEIESQVLPAINDSHTQDQRLVLETWSRFDEALEQLEVGTATLKVLHDTEREWSVQHKACRAEEEAICIIKRQCDYDLYSIWLRFVEEEYELRELSKQIEDHFCVEGANGTMWGFRDTSVVLFPPWRVQKPIVEQWETSYHLKVPECETHYHTLNRKTEECEGHQTELEKAACQHHSHAQQVREEFARFWDAVVSDYQRVVMEVHCLELDRWKEWRTLETVQCLLNRTRERNGRECNEATDEITFELAHCEEVQLNVNVDHLIIEYPLIPPLPPPCPTPPWEVSITVLGACIPVLPQEPCTDGFLRQEYGELWTPPQPLFHSENSHCNQRQECEHCASHYPEDPLCEVVFGMPYNFIYPTPEDECHHVTQAHVDSWSAPAPGELPAPLSDLQRSRDRTTPQYIINMIAGVDQDYNDFLCPRSTDGCQTIDGWPGATTHSELRYDHVVAELARIPEMEVSGQIRRLGDLGYFIFNDLIWEDDWKTFPIGADLEDHRKGRPIADAVMGADSRAWNRRMIREKAEEFFQGRDSFTEADLTIWNNKLLHKILLDMDLTDEQERFFEQYKSQSFLLSLMPKDLVLCTEPHFPQVEAMKAMRNQLLDMYIEALDTDTRMIIPAMVDAHDKRFLADLFLTALTSAGGLSVPTLMGIGFAILNGAEAHGPVVMPNWQEFELTDNNIEQFVLECVRRFPAVVGFPWWDPQNQQTRSVLNIAMALRDPQAWEAPKEFRLRPLSEYHETRGTGTKIGLAWAQQGMGNHGLSPDSRGCPGQDLSVVIMSEMFRAYMPSQKDWSVAGVEGTLQITEGPSSAKSYTLVRNGASPAPEASMLERVATSPLAAMAANDPTAIPQIIGDILMCMPDRWYGLQPPEVVNALGVLPHGMTGEAIPPEMQALMASVANMD